MQTYVNIHIHKYAPVDIHKYAHMYLPALPLQNVALAAGAVEYTNCISAEG